MEVGGDSGAVELISSSKMFGGFNKRYKHFSPTLGCSMTFTVYFPSISPGAPKLPILYWLSGLTCNDENFITKSGAQRAAAKEGIALVVPDTSPPMARLEGETSATDVAPRRGEKRTHPESSTVEGSKRARASESDIDTLQGTQFEVLYLGTFRPRNNEHLEAYKAMKTLTFKPTRFASKSTLKEIGIWKRVSALLTNSNLARLCLANPRSYVEETMEFMSSIHEVSIKQADDPTSKHRQMKVRINNVDQVLTELVLNKIFCSSDDEATRASTGLLDKDDSCFSASTYWAKLTGKRQYKSGASKASTVHSGLWRIMHKIVANVLFTKSETGSIYHEELYILSLIMEGKPVNIGRLLIDRWLSISSSPQREYCMGGLISLIYRAYRHPPSPKGFKEIHGDSLINSKYLISSGILVRRNDKIHYRFLRTDIYIPLPELADYDEETLLFTEEELIQLITKFRASITGSLNGHAASSSRVRPISAVGKASKKSLPIIREETYHETHDDNFEVLRSPLWQAKPSVIPVIPEQQKKSTVKSPHHSVSRNPFQTTLKVPISIPTIPPPAATTSKPPSPPRHDVRDIHDSPPHRHHQAPLPSTSRAPPQPQHPPTPSLHQSSEMEYPKTPGGVFGREIDSIYTVTAEHTSAISKLTKDVQDVSKQVDTFQQQLVDLQHLPQQVAILERKIDALAHLPQLMQEILVVQHQILNNMKAKQDQPQRKLERRVSRKQRGREFHARSPGGLNVEGESDSWDFGVGAGFYLNATQEKWKNWRMYDYIVKELPKLLHDNFEQLDTSRSSISGHSMGGHGALTIFLKNPDKFKSVSAFAPIVNPVNCPWGHKAFSNYLGENKSDWEEYDATCLVKKFSNKMSAPILIDQGEDDKFLKDQLLSPNFEAACKSVDVPLVLRMQPGYDHSYYFIATFIEDHISHHAQALRS